MAPHRERHHQVAQLVDQRPWLLLGLERRLPGKVVVPGRRLALEVQLLGAAAEMPGRQAGKGLDDGRSEEVLAKSSPEFIAPHLAKRWARGQARGWSPVVSCRHRRREQVSVPMAPFAP